MGVCPMCNGKGWLIKNPFSETKTGQGKKTCSLCGGTGKSKSMRII